MPTNETNQLIDIILNDGFKKFKDYWEINKKLLDNNIDKLKKLPIKIVYNSTDIALNKPYNLMKTDSLDNNNDDYKEDLDKVTLQDYLIEAFSVEIVEVIVEKMDIFIHGLRLDLQTPLLFIFFNFCYLDNFLYISLSNKF